VTRARLEEMREGIERDIRKFNELLGTASATVSALCVAVMA
jgi:hypothetical protein